MRMTEPARRNEREDHRLSLALLGAYAAALILFAILLYPHFDFFEHETDTHAEAVDFFITACVILAGVVPLLVLPFILIARMASRRRAPR
jgi:hypothetical protein